MKSTLADNKQLFNVKEIAAAGLNAGAIPEGQFGIIDSSTGLTVLPADFDSLPDKFTFVSKLDGKTYYSFSEIEKDRLRNKVAKDYTPEQINIWKTRVESCSYIDFVQLIINIDEASLMQRDGLTWTHRDFVVEVAPQELKCYCSCDGEHPAYENNVLTKLLVEKTNSFDSPFYEAEAQLEDGTVVEDLEQFIEDNKAANTGDDPSAFVYLDFVLKGKEQGGGVYRDIDVNYVYPRGVKLTPGLSVDGVSTKEMEEVQPLMFEIGAGYDLRAEEWDNMNNYTTLNYYPRLSDGIYNSELQYQFENKTNYNTVTFEYYTDKVERNNGDKRSFGVLLASSDAAVYEALKDALGL